MDKKQARKRVEKLKKEINFHRYNYHVLDKLSISEAALDALKNELFKLEEKYPDLVSDDSPTQRMGGQVADKFSKSRHLSPMLSLFDAFSEEDLFSWQDRLGRFLYGSKIKDFVPEWNYYCELKLDGLALNLRYEKGQFIKGSSRGDGKVGEDISSNVKTIESVPLKLFWPSKKDLKKISLSDEFNKVDTIEVRGEAIISKKDFIALNKRYEKEGRPLLSNTRNAAAGSLRQLDSKLSAERNIQFYAFDIILYQKGKKLDILKSREQANALTEILGFKVLKQNFLSSDLKNVFKFYKYWGKNRDKLAFDIDGVVVKVNEFSFWNKLGTIGKAPRYAMAYKFPAEQGSSQLKDVIWQVGRTGVLTPIAVLNPVKLSGATISRATLHNMDEIQRLGIMINDTVIVERSGDVIPKIVKVLKNLRTGIEHKIYPPKKCPICGASVSKDSDKVAYRCLNSRCYAVNSRQIVHFVSKKALDIENLGPKVVEQLLNEGLISDLADLYSLKKEDLLSLERFADKSADNLILAINNRRKISLARFIYALGIPNIGEESAESLADYIFSLLQESVQKKEISIDLFTKIIKRIKEEDLLSLDDFGLLVSRSVINFFQDEHNLKILNKLKKQKIILKVETRLKKDLVKDSRVFAKSFVLTGSLKSLTREGAKAKLKELGGKFMSSLSEKTDYLVLGENPGSKYDQAKSLGVKIIREEKFLKMIKYK